MSLAAFGPVFWINILCGLISLCAKPCLCKHVFAPISCPKICQSSSSGQKLQGLRLMISSIKDKAKQIIEALLSIIDPKPLSHPKNICAESEDNGSF